MHSFESFTHEEENKQPENNSGESWLDKDTRDLRERFAKDREQAAQKLEKRKKLLREKN